MKRTITLTDRTGQFDVPSFTLTENEALTIVFDFGKTSSAGQYIVIVRHGNAPKQTFSLSADKSLTLSAKWLNDGGTEPIEFSLALYNAAGTLKIKDDYCIEPLMIVAAAGKWTATAALQSMETEIETLKQTVSALSEKYNNLQEIVNGIPVMIKQAKKEAVIEAAGGDPMGA